ncbi:MAG: family 43 glycosylhydrolase [Clostridia bacterium]|nr:family 43 glycosylhydrolase [Clostridia bacterium]
MQTTLDSGEPISEYAVENNISKNLVRYGGATVTDNILSGGYIFGTTTDTAYTVYSKAKLDEDGIVGLYFGCSSSSPTTANGYYFEANTKEGNITVYRIESSNYRILAENKLHLLSNEAEIKVVYGKNYKENSVQFYFNDNPLVSDHYLDFDLALDLKGTGVGMYVENAEATTPVVITETTLSGDGITYQNFVLGNVTDPEVYYENGTYYIYCTPSGGLSGVQCYSTTDFITFNDLGIVLTVENAYGTKSVTAANVLKYEGTYYMFYLQYSDAIGYSTTAYATASKPQGPFVSTEKVPLTDQTDLIGGQPFVDDDGKIYLVYTRTTGGNRTYVSELKFADGKPTLDLDTETLLLAPSADWEYAKASVLECGFVVKHEGTYYLIYAGGNYNSTYGVGYATADNIYGPYTKYEHNPILWSNDQAFGNGAASVFVSPDQSEHFIIYLRNTSPTTTRPLNTCIDRIRFVDNPAGGNDILEIEGATVNPRPLPSGIGSTSAFDYQMARWHW